MPRFPQLDKDLHTDVLIIGGGLAGLLCAWNLKHAGVDCACHGSRFDQNGKVLNNPATDDLKHPPSP